jgi:hypothetical protein
VNRRSLLPVSLAHGRCRDGGRRTVLVDDPGQQLDLGVGDPLMTNLDPDSMVRQCVGHGRVSWMG